MSLRSTVLILIGLLVSVSLGVSALLHSLNEAPKPFPNGTTVVIESGESVRGITEILAEAGVIRSKTLLYGILVFFYEPTDIKASEYVFRNPLTTFAVAERLIQGDYDSDLVTLTFIEGERASDYAIAASEVLEDFNVTYFEEIATPLEGRLYPETYFVPATFTEDELFALLQDSFREATDPLQEQIAASSLTEEEVLILASIIEREANTPESMRMVSGILQNRIAIGMPLQADASIEYVLDTPLNELPPGQLAEELREVDSPYNTYLNVGLPPTPIGNPGLEAITAVLEPTPSDYFYYITGNDGKFYYAETLSAHNTNIARHLR